MRDFNDRGFRGLRPEDEARYHIQSQASWAVSRLGFSAGLVVALSAVVFLVDLPVVVSVLFFIALLVTPIVTIAMFIQRARRGDFRTRAPRRRPYSTEADLDDERRRKAMQRFRYRR